MNREYKIMMILREIEKINEFSDMIIDILYGFFC